ncbi:MAG: efflux RND transporter periplasmic adaptor subunit [Pseudomonadota bacterium]
MTDKRVSNRQHLALAGLLSASLLLLAACGDEGGQPQAGGAAPPPPTVLVSEPLIRDIVDWDAYTGRFDAIDTVEVRSRVSGYLQSVHFDDGDIVREGDLLYVIDQRPFLIAVERARATLTEAEASLSLAEAELRRARQLLDRGNISRSTFDERMQEQLAAEAFIDTASAELDAAELDLIYTQIEAPFTGRISRNLVTVGNLIDGGASDATLLTNIVSMSPIYFYFEANEAALLRYTRLAQQGTRPSSRDNPNPVQLQLSDEVGFPHWGTMDFVDNRIDADSGTITGRALFDNAAGLFTPGLFARLRLLASSPYEAMMIPEAAIGTDQSYKFVYVLSEDNRATYRRVTLGERRGDLRVITEGLAPDDQVVINGLMRIRPGSPVTPEPGVIGPGSVEPLGPPQ